jgi:hypothetical protein
VAWCCYLNNRISNLENPDWVEHIICIKIILKFPRLLTSSSPGEFHPQALTDPDVTVSRHPALIDQPKLAALLLKGSSSAMQSWPPNKADRSNPFAPSPLQRLPHYCGLVRPCAPHRYSHPRGSSTWISPLLSGRQVPTFPKEAWFRVTPLIHRRPLRQ